MKKEKSLKDYGLITLKGLGMGAADVVPGVSGGTIAFITGIYEELLATISSVNLEALKKLKSEGVISFWKYINGNFILALFLGIGVSIVSLAKLITFLMDFHAISLWSFFFGLVAASVFYVGKQIKEWSLKTVLGLILGAVFAFWITILPPLGQTDATWFVFVSGMIAICAMILPGISGSFILLILGSYETVMTAISDKKLFTIAAFAIGCLIGLLSFSRVLKWLFKKHENITIAVLTGFLIGSLNKLWPWKNTLEVYIKHKGEANEKIVPLVQENILPSNFSGEPQTLNAIIFALLGLILIFGMEFVAKKMKNKNA